MNILMAWELGGGTGHTVKLTRIGASLANKGHHISYALRNPLTAETLNIDPDTPIFRAPIMGVLKSKQQAAYDYADLLLRRGYEDEARLDSRIDAWLRLFDRTQPDQLVADHAPCARLAAHMAGIPSHAIGCGFAVPPFCDPLHAFLPSQQPRSTLQKRLETRLNEAINKALKRRGKSAVDRAATIFIGGSRFICTIEELDSYPDRSGETLLGPISQSSHGLEPQWPKTDGKRIFIYLGPDVPLLPVALAGLRRMKIPTLVFAGPDGAEHFAHAACPTITLAKRPVDMSRLADNCDLIICQGGNGTIAAGLIQGIPVLTYPMHVEQLTACRNMQSRGLGRMLTGKIEEDRFTQTVTSMLDDEAMHRQVLAVTKKYRDLKPDQVAEGIATSIDRSEDNNAPHY